MKRGRGKIALALLALPLCGCATLRGAWGWSPLPPLAATPGDLPASATQTLHAGYPGGRATLLCAFAGQNQGWRSACVSPAGLRVLTLEMDASGHLALEPGPGVPPQLDPARIAADIQLAFWPLDALQSAQEGSAWKTFEASPGTRVLEHGGRLVSEVHYASADPWNGVLWIANFRDDYSLHIVTRTGGDDGAR